MYIHIYTYLYIYIYIFICIHIYIYRDIESKAVKSKCAWVARPVDLSTVVEDLAKALSSQQLG
jgi:hypothetical protein